MVKNAFKTHQTHMSKTIKNHIFHLTHVNAISETVE